MKIKYPKPKKENGTEKKKWQNDLSVLILLVLFFVGGIYAERNGILKTFSSRLGSFALDQFVEELNTESQLYKDSSLPTIYLDIPFDSMLTLTEKREKALRIGILLSSDDDYVPAEIHINDAKKYAVDLRLKGDWTDHLMTSKWSYRIHVNDAEGAIFGMQRFSLQAPITRNYVHEWTFHQNLIMEGILTTRYDFVNVVINGEHKGIYAIEESFTEDLLESQQRREGVIFRYDENLLWTDWANGGFWPTVKDFWISGTAENSEITPFRSNHIAGDAVLQAELQSGVDLLNAFRNQRIPAEQVLDEELWGRFYAVTDLWAGGHAAYSHNYRFYYNPVTGLIEPVVFDALALYEAFTFDEIGYPFLEGDFFRSTGIQKAYVETLERITKPQYLQTLEAEFGAEVSLYNQTLLQEYTNRTAPSAIEIPWNILRERASSLANNINPVQPIRGNYQVVGDVLQLDLVNLMVLPVELRELRWGDETVSLDALQCSGTTCDVGLASVQDTFVLTPTAEDKNALIVPFQLPMDVFASAHSAEEEITLFVNLYGGSNTFEIPILTNYVPEGITAGALPTATLEEALAAHEFLHILSDHQLALEQGVWDVNTDLILPEGYSLNIPRGTMLRFGTGISFIARGSVDMFGTEDEPITITSQNGAWGGMLILKAEDTSDWEYVTIGEMSGIPYPGLGITGGVTFYQSDVNIRISQIGNNQTEDAINVIRSEFAFEQVEFLNAPSDAFDGDFVHGTVSHCSFHDIAGDGVDVSGSHVSVDNSYFVNLGDKAISAGEHSQVTATNLTIRDVGIGVASKDLSDVTISTSSIEGARVAGLAAYIKKPQYGAGTISATDVEILDDSTAALCQTKSEITLNGVSIPPQDFDVDALYSQGILGN